ncbi:MAG TPA: hypothetical protein VF941_13615 [Clostridia bacterium]
MLWPLNYINSVPNAIVFYIAEQLNLFINSLLEKYDNTNFLVVNSIKNLKSLNVVLPTIYKIEKIVGEARIKKEMG